MGTQDLNRPVSWGETILALGPILLFTVLYVLGAIISSFFDNPNNPALGLGLLFTMAGAVLVALVAGWVKNFPRWVFPYWGFSLLITYYFYSFSGKVAGEPFAGDLRVWIPLGIVVLVGLLWTRNLRPLISLVQSIWKDWTLLSFAFYGTLPLLTFAAYDETRDQALMHIVILLILGVGTIFYMRLENPWYRFASLVGGFTIGWLALMINLGWYWHGRQEYWMPKPVTWVETFNWTSRFGATLMFILVAPVLIEILRRAVSTKQIPPALQKPSVD